jgi:ATP-dependent exoDNAse (exonuclease V) beta subunit
VAELLRFPPSPAAAPPDAEARQQALDVRRSFIVEAPAGSGKTGLLIQRLLKLLADDSVEQPEQVLAITFTNKATAEMRDRVLAHLAAAAQSNETGQSTAEPAVLEQLAAAAAEPAPAENDFQAETRELARAVLARDRQLGWSLADHPHRLNIRTIDSVCAEIARTLPYLSGSGGRLTPAEDAGPLHREAARRTLLLLGTGDADFDTALRDLLLHRDGNLAECESLLANMLSLRDQWGDLVPLTGPQFDEVWLDANVLPRLELALDHAIRAVLTPLAQAFPADLLAELTNLAAEMAHCEGYKGQESPIAICKGKEQSPSTCADDLEHWRCLIHLIVKPSKPRDWRKTVSRNVVGFEIEKHHATHLKGIIARLSETPNLFEMICAINALPPAHYPADQWAVAKSLFRVLSRALVELQFVFSARNQCDFTELSLLARHALRADSGPDDLAAALGARLQHLLVDEMQDTSTSQYELIELLTASWDGFSQTVFLVGDPRQSIYLFRQARVERYIRAMRTQRLGDLPLTRLRLTANFRSLRTLVEQFNRDFNLIFPQESDPHALPYTPAQPTLPASPSARGAVWHANPISTNPDDEASEALTPAQLKQQQARRDALELRRIVSEWLAKPLPPGRSEPWQIAVLVRSRNHLIEIVAALKQEDAIPFRAVEIDSLGQRQEVLDLTALTRALLHPADRVAALAVLRAPWCGLSLADLHTLTGCDDPALQCHSIQRLMDERGHLLPDDSCKRLQRVWQVLAEAAAQRARLTPAQLVERAWRSLGGDAWLKPEELINAQHFFNLLDELQTQLQDNSSTGIFDPTLLDARLQKLYAEPNPTPAGTPFVELLTIHKAKGLEWDVVLVPALERQPAADRSRLLTWSELEPMDASDEDAAHFMLAPIAGRGEPSKALNNWLNGIHRAREAAERKRLFYVACTRARQELHLFASPQLTSSGEINPRFDSLLQAAWPAAKAHFSPTENLGAPDGVPGERSLLAGVARLDSETWVRATNLHVFNPTDELDLAASASPTLQRFPLDFDPAARIAATRAHRLPYGDSDGATASSQAQFSRPEGSFAARSFGNVVHAALETLADRIAAGSSTGALLAELPAWMPRLATLLRADGLPHATINRLAREARAALEATLRDPDGLWLLAPHAAAANEFALTAWPESHNADGQPVIRPTSIRIDRLFRAGAEPHSPGEDFLWIVDYKTTAPHSSASLDDFLAAQRAAYAPQLETYARILTQLLHSADRPAPKEVRLALYYPTLPRLLWWPFT